MPPAGNGSGSDVNTDCPSAVSGRYNFFPDSCANGECAECNSAPASNGSCHDPLNDTAPGYCLDQPPAAEGGLSRICSQVPIEANYPEAYRSNLDCHARLGPFSVWSHYLQVSTQGFAFDTAPTGCENAASQIGGAGRQKQLPQVAVDATSAGSTKTRPFLANNSMESYGRSNCNGCHSGATFKNAEGKTLNTDFAWFLALETCAVYCKQNGLVDCECLD